KLQERHHETLTASQMEQVGTEVGLDAAFVRLALAHIGKSKSIDLISRVSKVEFYSVVFALAFPLVWASIAFLSTEPTVLSYRGFASPILTFFVQVTPAPLAALMGFIAGKKRVGLLSGISLALALTPLFTKAIAGFWDGPTIIALPLLGGWLGYLGASIRE